jgi:pimeloyl-ACP methyl ester carboxylesterase
MVDKAAERSLSINGCGIALQRAGNGEAMLFLHGANGASAWTSFFDILAQDFDLLVPEHPGFGKSDMPDWLDNIHDLAYFYAQFLRELDVPRVHIVGASIGGWLALEMAVRDTSRIASLSLIAPAGIHVKGVSKGDIFMWSYEEAMAHAIFDEKLRDSVLARPRTADDMDLQLKNSYATARVGWQPRLYDPHLHKWLHLINVPTHLFWGAQDRVIPVAYADAFAALIPGAGKTVLDECGHLPQLEKPGLLAQGIKDFISGRQGK